MYFILDHIYCSMEKEPLISICIPTRNRPKELSQAINSAVNQTYKNIEIIVSDDNSEEKYKINQIVSDFNNRNIKYYYHKTPLGLSQNWNFCVSNVKGEYFLMLSDDDYLNNDAIQKLYNLIKNNKSAILAQGNVVTVDKDNNHLGYFKTHLAAKEGRQAFFKKLHFKSVGGYPCAQLYKTKFVQDVGGYNENVGVSLDIVLELQAYLYGEVYNTKEFVAYLRLNQNGLTRNKIKVLIGLMDFYYTVINKKIFLISNDIVAQKRLTSYICNNIFFITLGNLYILDKLAYKEINYFFRKEKRYFKFIFLLFCNNKLVKKLLIKLKKIIVLFR